MNILERVVRLETTLWSLVERSLIGEGRAGLGTFLALQILHRHDGAGRVQDLSRELSITIGAASKVVDRLERAELAVRRPHPEDRRSSLVALTAQGESERAAADVVVRRVIDVVFGDDEALTVAGSVIHGLQHRVDGAATAVAA